MTCVSVSPTKVGLEIGLIFCIVLSVLDENNKFVLFTNADKSKSFLSVATNVKGVNPKSMIDFTFKLPPLMDPRFAVASPVIELYANAGCPEMAMFFITNLTKEFV